MKERRFYILIAITVVLFSGYIFDISSEVRNFILASTILAFQVVDPWMIRTQSRSAFIFKIWSTQWVIGIAFGFFLIYSFLDDQMNSWNRIAIAEAIAYGVLYVIQHRFTIYGIENLGIRNLSNGGLINSSTITNIKIEKTEIRIDTTKYQNDLIIKADVLHSPTWDELVHHIKSVRSNGG